MSLRALQRRVQRLETGAKPRPSPFTVWFGSFDGWVEREVLPAIQSGGLDADDIIVVVGTLREWEDGRGVGGSVCALTVRQRGS